MIEVRCPDCGSVRQMSLLQDIFEGPYRCWKCRSLFTIVVANKKLQSCEPLSEEDFAKWQEAQDASRQ